MEDLADGYDRDDPFIDDSECFDEEVPQVCILFQGSKVLLLND